MPLSTEQWHARYTRQTGWTAQLRGYLFERYGIASAQRVLDCGSGTGALEASDGGLSSSFRGTLVGLDINRNNLAYAKSLATSAAWVQGDGLLLPFAAESFELVFCHFFLLWVADPLQALHEMRRVTRPGGSVIALAEPDYGGRIDFPPELEVLANWQQASLRRQGANPFIGRRLGWMFQQAGLEHVETGVLGAQWNASPAEEELASEWEVLRSDLEMLFGTGDIAPWQGEYEKLKRLDESAWESGERVLYVPTFYASGKKPPSKPPNPNRTW
jgi:ubiquinone/menaquinone biosynthesis C-methylase UbiE